MSTKTVYQTDADGVLIGTTLADESPLETGVFLIPAGCVEVEPPPHVEGKRRVFSGGSWTYQDIPEPEAPAPKSVEDLLEEKNADINNWRDRQENQPILFEHAGRTWDGGLATRRRLDPVASLAALPEDFFWTDAANTDVPVTLAEVQALRTAHEAALVEQGFRIHVRQRQMKQEVQALADAGDAAGVESYVVGWPEEQTEPPQIPQ